MNAPAGNHDRHTGTDSPARVSRLWRYPVKSMLGQRCPGLEIGAPGVRGDRRYAVRDARGLPASGKSMDGFSRIQGLLEFAAGHEDDDLVIRFPDGQRHRFGEPGLDEVLSAALGQPVTLRDEGAADGSYVDASPIHLLTTASLAWLEATLPAARVDERRFRPNFVVDWPGEEPVEQDWIGRHLRVGEVELRITGPTERCGMVSMAHDDLPRDPAVLRHITRAAALNFGVYAEVLVPGRIVEGDAVALLPAAR